jgi:hypothetical protein
VAKPVLHRAKVSAGIKQVGGDRVLEGVAAARRLDGRRNVLR